MESLTSAYHMGSYRAAVCTPSRIMLMTGRNLWETQGFNVNYPPLNYVHDVEKNYKKIDSLDPSKLPVYHLFLKGMGIIHLEPRKGEIVMKAQTYYLMRDMIRPIVKTMT